MLPTPSTSHVSFDNVYEPAEDSFLFLDTLSKQSEVDFLSTRFHSSASSSPLVLEVGSGSGVVLSFIASNAMHLFGRQDVLTVATDVNLFACKATNETVCTNLRDASASAKSPSGAYIGSVNGDLTCALRNGCVDVVIFNPPYVPSDPILIGMGRDRSSEGEGLTSEEKFCRDNKLLALATDGGLDGMEVTNRLMRELKTVLNPARGVAYILLCAQNKPERVKQEIETWGSEWAVETVGQSGKQGGWEKLQIVRIWRRGMEK